MTRESWLVTSCPDYPLQAPSDTHTYELWAKHYFFCGINLLLSVTTFMSIGSDRIPQNQNSNEVFEKIKTHLHQRNRGRVMQMFFWLERHKSKVLGVSELSCEWWVLYRNSKYCFVKCSSENSIFHFRQSKATFCTVVFSASVNFCGMRVKYPPYSPNFICSDF